MNMNGPALDDRAAIHYVRTNRSFYPYFNVWDFSVTGRNTNIVAFCQVNLSVICLAQPSGVCRYRI